MKITRLLYSVVLLGCFTTGHLYAQTHLKGCDGKNYNVGDTLHLGMPTFSGYLFVNKVAEDGNFTSVDGDCVGSELVITDIPPYSQKLYEAMAIFEKPVQSEIIFAENESGKYCINLNQALSHGNIASVYKKSAVKDYQELTPAVLFAYSMKLYAKPVDKKAIETYLSLCDPTAYQDAKSDPFVMEELTGSYKDKLEKAVAAVDFNQVYRMKCLTEAGDYNMESQTLAIDGFYPLNVDTDQKNELSKIGYFLWGDCAFHFTNTKEYSTIISAKQHAKSMYSLKKLGNHKHERTITLTSYVYVRIQNKPTILPQTRITVRKPGNIYDFDFSTLDKEYGKKSLLMDITHIDCYFDVIGTPLDKEVKYNYVGSM